MRNALGCLLKRALAIVPEVEFEYRVLKGRVTNDLGNLVATYGAWTKSRGSVQPGLAQSFNGRGVSDIGQIMKAIGIDQSKKIMTVYAHGIEELRNVHDQDMPDQVRYHGLIYNIWSVSDWLDYDGWKVLICVEDTREREPVVYKTEIIAGAQIITNPTNASFLFTKDVGNRNDQIIFYNPILGGVIKKSSGWKYNSATGLLIPLDRAVMPNESIVYQAQSPFTLVWGTDE